MCSAQFLLWAHSRQWYLNKSWILKTYFLQSQRIMRLFISTDNQDWKGSQTDPASPNLVWLSYRTLQLISGNILHLLKEIVVVEVKEIPMWQAQKHKQSYGSNRTWLSYVPIFGYTILVSSGLLIFPSSQETMNVSSEVELTLVEQACTTSWQLFSGSVVQKNVA